MKHQVKLMLLLLGLAVAMIAQAQYTTDKVVGQKNAAVVDSMKHTDYPYLLPIWGKKVYQRGFKLPKSAGLSSQYIGQISEIIISNLSVGFNEGPMYDLSNIVRIENAEVRSSGINARPDLWVFPFLNVYGILAWSKTQTSIDAGVWVPKNDSTSHQVTSFSTTAHFNAKTMGFGLTPTMGVGGYFFALDMNFTWTDVDKLNSPAFAFILGPRLGKNFQFKKPDMALAVWIGGFRVHLNSGTEGNIAISDIMPEKEFGAKVDEGLAGVAAGQEKVDAWWNGLSTAEQNNPLNIAKHNALNSALEKAGNFLLAADQVASNLSNTTVQYSLDKKPKDMWNFLIGAQFQINRDWMIRTELGFLGTRTQFIGGIQYRFNL